MTLRTFKNASLVVAKSVLFLTTSFFLACGGGNKKDSSGQVSDKLSYRIDTMMVDAGDEILYVKGSLIYSDLDKDAKYLYNFNRNQHALEKINLDEGSLEKMISLENEGPNSIDPYFSFFKVSDEEEIIFCTNTSAKIFDLTPKLIKEVNFDQLADNKISDTGALLSNLLRYSKEKDRFIGMFNNWKDSSYFILDMDNAHKKHKLIELPELDKLSEYVVDIVFNGNFAGSFGSVVRALYHENQILITNNIFNEVLIFDLDTEEMKKVAWESELIGSRRKLPPTKEVEIESDQHFEVFKKVHEDIHYGQLRWDPDGEKFYRFSYKEKYGEEREPKQNYQLTGAEVFLSVFDADLNLLAESEVPELNIKPQKHFYKDGAIWFFENFEDEMGFIRFFLTQSLGGANRVGF